MGLKTISINGTTVPDIYIDTSLAYNKPERLVEAVSVPGRSGDLVVDLGKFSNVLISYPAYIKDNFSTKWAALIQRLAPLKGYQRIETSDDAAHFRMGRVIIPQSPDVVRINQDGFFSLAFDCKPQRYLTSGETTTTYTSASSTVTNPTKFDAKPMIRVNGTGTCTVNGVQITVGGSYAYVDIDCEAMECFYGTNSANSIVSFTGNDFPVLSPGNNTISKGTVTSVAITPRWWEL